MAALPAAVQLFFLLVLDQEGPAGFSRPTELRVVGTNLSWSRVITHPLPPGDVHGSPGD